MALAAQQRYDEAIREFQAAVVLRPNAAPLHNNLGYAYLLSGANEKAVKELEEAARLDPGHERSRENLRMAKAMLGGTVSASPAPDARSGSLRAVTEPSAGTQIIEVTPQVFELRTTATRSTGKIEAVPLDPLPSAKASIAPK